MNSPNVGWVYSERFLDHFTGETHPERPARLYALLKGLLKDDLLSALVPVEFQPATDEAISMVHDPAYVEVVEMACQKNLGWLGSMDTGICAASDEVARLAVGGVLAACDGVMSGKLDRAFCAVRPPGHHAEVGQAMGFCLFNNIAIAAEHLLRNHGIRRVAIVDFDVHHGNGTQHAFEDRSDVLFISLHENPQFLYPGTGYVSETGRGEGEGHTLNVPMPPSGGDDDYRDAFVRKVIPSLEAYRPEFLLVSAGFDAAAGENIAHMNLTPAGFSYMTSELVSAAKRFCDGRMVSTLEGGYEEENLEACVPAHVKALLGYG